MTINPAAREVSPITAENRRVGIQLAKKEKLDLNSSRLLPASARSSSASARTIPLQAFEFSLSGS